MAQQRGSEDSRYVAWRRSQSACLLYTHCSTATEDAQNDQDGSIHRRSGNSLNGPVRPATRAGPGVSGTNRCFTARKTVAVQRRRNHRQIDAPPGALPFCRTSLSLTRTVRDASHRNAGRHNSRANRRPAAVQGRRCTTLPRSRPRSELSANRQAYSTYFAPRTEMNE